MFLPNFYLLPNLLSANWVTSLLNLGLAPEIHPINLAIPGILLGLIILAAIFFTWD